MTACANCDRALQPAWKFCIYCGTRIPAAAPAASEPVTAPRSRPLPKRTAVPGYAVVTTSQTPIVPVPAPAPLAGAPVDQPVSSEWPESLGERPSLRSTLEATEVPAPTPPREEGAPPEGEQEPEPEEPEPDEPGLGSLAPPDHHADALADEDDDDEPLPEPSGFSIADLAHDVEADEDEAGDDDDDEDDDPAQPEPDLADDPEPHRRPVNVLAILALAIGILACPLAALFGHLALGQLKVSGERGVIPAWIALVLGYLWLGFWIVIGVTFLATNG